MVEEFPRHLERVCRDVLRDTPILVLQGARQVGKSTLASRVAPPTARRVNLDERRWRDFAQQDPEGFVRQHPDGLLVVDEAQRAPEIVLALKAAVDADRQPGRFLLTGSVDLFQAQGVGDSLAGRKETLVVSPLSVGETERRPEPEDFVTWLLEGASGRIEPDTDVALKVVRGGFPEVVVRGEGRRAGRWLADYVDSLTRHDAADLSDGDFSDHLAAMLRWLAAQGQAEVVKAKLARQLGIAQSTADVYLRLLTAMFLVNGVPSWGLGFSGREVRRPKASLVDSGLASHLVGFTADQALSVGGRDYYGLLLEAFVAQELRKQQAWSATDYRLYHFRRREREVDLVIEVADGSVILVEVKASLGVDASSWRQMSVLRDEMGARVKAGVVLYGGAETMHLHDWLHVLPVSALWRHEPVER